MPGMRISFFVLAVFLAALPLAADNKHTPAPAFEPTLPWITDLDQAIALSKQTGKPILTAFR